MPTSTSKLWASKVKSSFQPLTKIASPTYSDDGIPSILAPESITLVSSNLWKDHLVAFFHGTPPSTTKIFADLNPIWGTAGRISVKNHSNRTVLIHIPCPIIRQWALDIALWHSGNCSFTLSAWSPSLNLTPMKLDYAPLWVLFKKVPPELWSLQGFSTIASGVGFPVFSEFPDLKPYSNGVIKLRVVVELAKKKPSTVRITDKLGNAVFVSVEFPKYPPKCSKCKEFGHLELRCPSALSKFTAKRGHFLPNPVAALPYSQTQQELSSPSGELVGVANVLETGGGSLLKESACPAIEKSSIPSLIPATEGFPASKNLSRTKSLPSSSQNSVTLSSKPRSSSLSREWIRVGSGSSSKQSVIQVPRPQTQTQVVPLTTEQLIEEEELIKSAQAIIRLRLAAIDNNPSAFPTALSRKNARKKHRQKLKQLSDTSTVKIGSSSSSSHFGLASDEQAPVGSVLPNEA